MVTALLIPELSLKVRNLDPSKLREAIEEGYEVRNQTPPAGNWKTSPGIVSGDKSMPRCAKEGHDEEFVFGIEEPGYDGDLKLSETRNQSGFLETGFLHFYNK